MCRPGKQACSRVLYLGLAECGPSRTWVIIEEVTKVLKTNEAALKPPACCTAYRDLAKQDITNGAWAMFVDLEQVISEHVTVLLTVDACRILKC